MWRLSAVSARATGEARRCAALPNSAETGGPAFRDRVFVFHKVQDRASIWQAFQLLQQGFYELGSLLCFSPGASVEVSDLSNFVIFAI